MRALGEGLSKRCRSGQNRRIKSLRRPSCKIRRQERRRRPSEGLNLALKLLNIHWRRMISTAAIGRRNCLIGRIFNLFGLDDVLGSRVVNLQTVCSLFNCLSLNVHQLDQLIALRRIHRVVAALRHARVLLVLGSGCRRFWLHVAQRGTQLVNIVLTVLQLDILKEHSGLFLTGLEDLSGVCRSDLMNYSLIKAPLSLIKRPGKLLTPP